MFNLIGGTINNFVKSHPELKDIGSQLSGGTRGLNQEDGKAAASFLVHLLNVQAFKGKLTPAQEQMLANAGVQMGKFAIKVVGGFFGKKK